MAYDFDDLQNADVVIGAAGLAGTGLTEGQKTGLISDVEALKAHGLMDHADSVAATPLDGDVLVWVEALGGWLNLPPPGGLTDVNASGSLTVPDVTRINFSNLFTTTEVEPGRVGVLLKMGTAINTVAFGNHSHSQTLKQTIRANNLTSVTSGTVLLVTNTIGPLTDGVVYDIDALAWCEGFSTLAGNSQAQLRVTINGNAVTTPTLTYEGGVDGPKLESHELTIVGTGAVVAITLHMVWVSGSIKPVACAVKVAADPRR